jgi:hypothetical protein
MTARVVVAPDLLLAAVVAGPADTDGPAARHALETWIEAGAELLVAGPAWPAMLDALRSRGWSAARIAEAIHALHGLDLRTVEVDQPALLLAADVMERHGLAAATALAVVLADLESVPLVALDPAAAALAPATRGAGEGPAGTGRATLPDYRGLGDLLGELRSAALETSPVGLTAAGGARPESRPGARPRPERPAPPAARGSLGARLSRSTVRRRPNR